MTSSHSLRPKSWSRRGRTRRLASKREELEQARQEKEDRLARIAAVNKGQVTVGASLPGKAFTVVLLIGVFAALVLVVGDPQNCEFLPTTKDACMARPA